MNSGSRSWLSVLLPLWLATPPPGTPMALGVRGDRVLVGTERGLYLEGEAGWTLVLTRGGVRDLVTTPGATLIATGAGLYEWPPGVEMPRAVPLGAGARVRSVDIDSHGTAWVASEVGLFKRSAGERTFRRETSIPSGPVARVRSLSGQVWVATRGTLWRAERGQGFQARLRGLDAGWWELGDVAHSVSGVWLSVPRGLWNVSEKGVESIQLGLGSLRAIRRVQETLWVASESGIHALAVEGLLQTVSTVAFEGEGFALALASSGLLVATRRGVALLPLAHSPRAPLGLKSRPSRDGSLRTLQRAVLAYLELSPARIARIERRARRAALYPQVRAGFSLEREGSLERERDQIFSSGSVRNLFDWETERAQGMEFSLQLVWDLARIAEPDHALAVSRERRQLIELRDQVLERVNRLYFERQRVLARLDALAPEAGGDRSELEIRARELRAHLDSWSGGVFSRLVAGTEGDPR